MADTTIEGFGLSPLQNHLWRLAGADANRIGSTSIRVRIRGTIDAEAVREALLAVQARHEILRTAFPLLPGTHVPVQSILDEGRLRFERADLGAEGQDDRERETRLVALETELGQPGFDVQEGDVLHACLARLADDDHTLILVQPSLAADVASLWNLASEVVRELAGVGAEDASEVDDDEESAGPMQYADIAQWLHENFESEDAQEGLRFWRAVEPSAAHGLRLPLGFDRGGDATAPATQTRPVDPATWTALEQLAASSGTSLDAVLFSAWQVVIARLGELDKLVTGHVSTGRSYEGLDQALGLFARALPIRVELSSEEPFAELVRRVERSLQTATEWHELFDFERAGGRAGDSLPISFALHPERAPLQIGPLQLELEQQNDSGEPFRVRLRVDGAARRWHVDYDPRWLDAEAAAVLLDQVATLARHASTRPEQPTGELELVSDLERERLLEVFASEPPLAIPASCSEDATATIDALIAAQASRTPDATAVSAEGRSLTYAELNTHAERLARHLRELEVGPGVFVGLYLDRSVEMLVGLLGVLKAGAAYLPLPPGYPAERISFMLEDTGAPVVLTRRSEAASLPSFDGNVVRLDDEQAPFNAGQGDAGALESLATPDDPAYVIYTSGSTGKPKGVPIAHRNLLHSTCARMAYYEVPVENYLLLSSFAFDSSVAGIFWTLCQGGALVLPEDGFEQEIPRIAELIRERRITHMLALPSLYAMIVDTAAPGAIESLRTVIVAGESCPPELVAAHGERLPGTKLYNEYGPTEGTVWSTVYDTSRPFQRAQVPIGRPVPGAHVYVVDSGGELAPIGAAGELWVAGPGVAEGYLGRPELTAAKFVQPAFLGAQGRCYCTGDRVRFLADGQLEFLGRIDHQVKIRGYRIELEEIEATLLAQSGVREAVVLAREDSPGDQRLVAYLSTTDEGITANTLREALARPLPDYMVPAHFVFLPELPLLPNGKVDRKTLPAPDQDRSSVSAAYVEPASALEKVLAVLWSDVLGVERIGAQDDFFELGGHSILATQLFARMVETLQVTIPLRAIFDHRTIAALAEEILRDPNERPRLERTAEIVLQVLEADEE